MLTLTHPVQLVIREDHAGNTPYHQTSISIGGRPICNLRFSDNINLMGGSHGELQDLTNRLVDRATAYGMEVSIEKSKIMTNSTKNIIADVTTTGLKLKKVTTFRYLGANLCKDGTCSAEVRIRIASAWRQWPE